MMKAISQARLRRARGFSLVELMVVLVIIGVLSAVAIPSYRKNVQSTQRAAAKAIMAETTQYMERYYTTNNSYVGGTLSSAVSPKGATGTSIAYNISFTATPTASAYTVQAVPANGQSSDSCGTLSLASTGAQSATGTGSCW
jgi:type IV pilus assembly protein PilE